MTNEILQGVISTPYSGAAGGIEFINTEPGEFVRPDEVGWKVRFYYADENFESVIAIVSAPDGPTARGLANEVAAIFKATLPANGLPRLARHFKPKDHETARAARDGILAWLRNHDRTIVHPENGKLNLQAGE